MIRNETQHILRENYLYLPAVVRKNVIHKKISGTIFWHFFRNKIDKLRLEGEWLPTFICYESDIVSNLNARKTHFSRTPCLLSSSYYYTTKNS